MRKREDQSKRVSIGSDGAGAGVDLVHESVEEEPLDEARK
jgi:hypothetical protein